MFQLKVLGGGCNNCKITVDRIEDVARELSIDLQIQKVENIQDIMAYDVMSTPAVVIDEKVVHRGSVPSRETIVKWLLNIKSDLS